MIDKWESLALCVFTIVCVGAWMIQTMGKSDASVECWQRGGEMMAVEGEMQCVTGRFEK